MILSSRLLLAREKKESNRKRDDDDTHCVYLNRAPSHSRLEICFEYSQWMHAIHSSPGRHVKRVLDDVRRLSHILFSSYKSYVHGDGKR